LVMDPEIERPFNAIASGMLSAAKRQDIEYGDGIARTEAKLRTPRPSACDKVVRGKRCQRVPRANTGITDPGW